MPFSRSMCLRGALAIACALTMAAAPAAAAPADDHQLEINYPNFGRAAAGLELNGSAQIFTTLGPVRRKVLRVTDGGYRQVGSAWAHGQVGLTAPFESTFKAYLHQGHGADGVALVLQTAGPRALGGWGGGLGYKFLRPSVAIEFDTFRNIGDLDANHLGVVVGGNPAQHSAVARSPLPLYGKPFLARVEYTGINHELKVYVRALNRGAVEQLMITYPIDLAATLGGDGAYIGFTAATGSVSSKQDIYSWTVSSPSS